MQETTCYIQGAGDLPEIKKIGSRKLIQALKQELQASGITAEIDWKPNPQSPKADRELILAILAISASSVLIATAVKKVIDALNSTPVLVTDSESTPAIDRSGNVILDSAGDPVMTEKTTSHIVVPAPVSDSTGIKVFKVFEMSSASGKAAESQTVSKPAHSGKDKSHRSRH